MARFSSAGLAVAYVRTDDGSLPLADAVRAIDDERNVMNDLTTIHLQAPLRHIGRLIVFFWAMYFTLVALTNLVDLLDSLGAIHWQFLDSGNFGYLHSVVKIYDVGPTATRLLLAGAIAIEGVGAYVFWRAARRSTSGSALTALSGAAAIWIAFIFMTEFFVAYTAESPFRELLLLTIASAIYFAVIPDLATKERAHRSIARTQRARLNHFSPHTHTINR